MEHIIIDNIKFYYDKRNGYYFNFNRNKKIYLHRYIWEKHNGEIPKGFIIHHKDNDRTNNNIENLECISRSDHSKGHKKPKNIKKEEYDTILHLHSVEVPIEAICNIVDRGLTTVNSIIRGLPPYHKGYKGHIKNET